MFAMIYVKFNHHKRLISYSLWKGHGEMKISPWKKKLLPISSEWKDAHISNFPRSKRTLKHMCGAKITARGSCVRKLFKVFQLYTCLKCTQSTLPENSFSSIFFFSAPDCCCLFKGIDKLSISYDHLHSAANMMCERSRAQIWE